MGDIQNGNHFIAPKAAPSIRRICRSLIYAHTGSFYESFPV